VRHTTATVIVANRALLREGIASLLQNTPYKVVAAVTRPADLKHVRLANRRPVLAIVGMDETDGSSEIADRVALLRSLCTGATVVVVAETNEPLDWEGVALRADGYIVNFASREILLKALELTLLNEQVVVLGPVKTSNENAKHRSTDGGRTFGNGPTNGQGAVPLSHREGEVLMCLARGQSNKAIAQLCHIAEATVKVYLKAILRKTNAHNRTQAAIWAVDHGFREPRFGANTAVALNAPRLSPAEPPVHTRAEIVGIKA
jgi:two-component system, NarL family, nitrate/nitrite response regulator NarL